MTLQCENFNTILPALAEYRPEMIKGDGAFMRFKPDILRPEAAKLDLPTGVSLLAGVRKAMREAGYAHIPRGAKIHVARTLTSAPEEIPREQWGTFLIRHGMHISVSVPVHGGGGGKNPLNMILSIVVMAVAALVTWGLSGPGMFLGFTSWGLSPAIGSLAGALVMAGGMMLVNAIAPMSAPKLSQASALTAEKVWSIDGIRNKADLYGGVPLPLGKVRFAPRYFAEPYTYLSGNNQYARYLFGVMGHNKVSDLRIGDTPITRFKGVQYKVHEKWTGQAFSFFPAAVHQENLGVDLTQASGWHTRTTTQDTTEIQWEVHLPRGLIKITDEGDRDEQTVTFYAEYRPVGDSAWIGAAGGNRACSGGGLPAPQRVLISPGRPAGDRGTSIPARYGASTIKLYILADGRLGSSKSGETGIYIGSVTAPATGGNPIVSKEPTYSGSISVANGVVTVTSGTMVLNTYTITGKTVTPLRRGYSRKVAKGQYEFRIRRITGDPNADDKHNTYLNDTTWAVFKSVKAGPVLKYNGTPYTVIEVEIQATDQLNGHIDELNAVFHSICPTWNGGAWVEAASSNPAALCVMLATTPVIGDPVAMSSLDAESWQGFYDWCQTHGWAFNSVQTAQAASRELMHAILSAGRASFSLPNGRFGVVWDNLDKPVSYPYGPRNSWGFKAHKEFVKESVHGLRYLFLNEKRDWIEDERIVFADGYTLANATNIIEAEQDGVTDPGLIYKHGRLRLADSRWRPEVYEFSTDFSYLCVAKGDRVSITHDVPMWGLRQARITGVEYAAYDFASLNRAALASLALEHQDLLRPGLSAAEFSAWLDSLDDEALRDLLEEKDLRDTSLVEAVLIDDHVSLEGGKLYAFKYFAASGAPVAYSVVAEDATTCRLRLATTIPAASAPLSGGLIHFGEAGRETHDCIVVNLETQDNLCAKVVCQDYSADKIYTALTGPIPEWDSDISVPSRWQLGRPAAPLVTNIRTDEFVLLQLADGSLVPRIQVAFKLEDRQGVKVRDVRVEFRPKDGGEDWQDGGVTPAATGFVYVTGVEEGLEYEIRLLAVSDLGITSDYSSPYSAKVIGRLTPPPAPVRVFMDSGKVKWDMPANMPADVRGWEVWMGFDAEDPFTWARRISNEFVTMQEFDLTPWSGWARRVWIRTRDDLGLVSDPVSIVVNLGDMPVANVVYEARESERGWTGNLSGGGLNADLGIISKGGIPMWPPNPEDYEPVGDEEIPEDLPMWGALPMWGGSHQSIVYSTAIRVPPEADASTLSLDVVMPHGTLASVEYAYATAYEAWDGEDMWGDLRWDGLLLEGDYQVMPNDIEVRAGQLISVRITTSDASAANIADLVWVFDVEDLNLTINDFEVPAQGARLPVPPGAFRWIKSVLIGLYHDEAAPNAAFTAGWRDRGLIVDGLVTEGPLIQCRDEHKQPVAGVVDVTLQGARGF